MALFAVGFVTFVLAVLWNEYKSGGEDDKILARLVVLERITGTDNATVKDQLVRLQEHIDRLDKTNLGHAEWQERFAARVKQADDIAHSARVEIARRSAPPSQPQKILVEFSPVPLRVRRVMPKPMSNMTAPEAKKLLKKTSKQIRALSN